MRGVVIDFEHLTGCTSFDIFSYKGFHIGPPIVRSD